MVNKLEREDIYLNTILLLAAVVVDEHWWLQFVKASRVGVGL